MNTDSSKPKAAPPLESPDRVSRSSAGRQLYDSLCSQRFVSISQPSQHLWSGGRNGSTMSLPLRRISRDTNGNAFTSSSFSSSSSPSSSSPSSLRSCCSLSGADSPQDVDMTDVVTLTTEGNKMAAGVVVNVSPDNKQKEADDDDVSAGRDTPLTTEASEPNDNSVSVYLDAWNDNLTLSGDDRFHDDDSDDLSSTGRCGSDSNATEIPADDDDDDGGDDDDEECFVSVSSDMVVRRTSLTRTDWENLPSDGVSILGEFPSTTPAPLPCPSEGLEGQGCPCSGSTTTELQSQESGGPGLPDEEVPGLGSDLPPDLPVLQQPCREETELPDLYDLCVTPESGLQRSEVTEAPLTQETSPITPRTTGHVETKPDVRPAVSVTTRPTRAEVRRFPKQDLRNIKSKVQSRPAPASPKTTNHTPGKPPTANERKALSRKEDVKTDSVRRQRLAAGQVVKVAILRPVPKLRPNPNREPRVSNLSEQRRKVGLANQTCFSSSSSLGSDATGEGPQRTPEEAVQDLPVLNGEKVLLEGSTEVPQEGSTAGSKENNSHVTTNQVTVTKTPSEPRRDHAMKVSSKLGPSQGRARGAWGASCTVGPSPAPSSTTIPPGGEGGAAPRLPQAGASSAGKDGLSIGLGGSPLRGQQSQGIVKPRSTDRPSGLVPPGSMTSNPKPTANPGSAPARRRASKLPVKGLPTSLSSSSLGSVASETNIGTPPSRVPAPAPALSSIPGAPGVSQVEDRPSRSAVPPLGSARAPGSPPPHPPLELGRAPGLRTRAFSLQSRGSATGLRTPTLTNQIAAKNTPECLAETRLRQTQPPLPPPPWWTRAASGGRHPDPPPQPSRPAPRRRPSPPPPPRGRPRAPPAPPGLGLQGRGSGRCPRGRGAALGSRRKLLVQGNRRVEALAVVIQHLLSQREEALKQKKELSLELANLRDELVLSSQCCERLRVEGEEARCSLEERLQRGQQQQEQEQSALEERLRSFYQEEWDKMHLLYQEEGGRCRALLEHQMDELRRTQEAERQEQEVTHRKEMESLRQQYETSIQALRTSHQRDLEGLDRTLKDTEASLSERVRVLTEENQALAEKLRVEEETRRMLSDKSQKDSHTQYLERELESLRVVLEIRNTQLHQQDSKLMQLDKLMETNVKLEECLNKVQQENEDYRARMDKHAALSKQLSSEQVMLQQTLQKESKVNKRLSMENEELLWKLHNGDLASPRRLSPTSPFASPRNSASFTAPPLSPR
ncbi:LOW QUALITY PROTEIN: microtubule-associated tumor suppressor 1 homolog [Osmerus mordax]|uniref:LOW QUALITY PROTEIN: microtubule-associated tumor suppressor 1 homolog n=1 Tax=Osmerus mordax TaxID=8014 RepID=UPI00350FC778